MNELMTLRKWGKGKSKRCLKECSLFFDLLNTGKIFRERNYLL